MNFSSWISLSRRLRLAALPSVAVILLLGTTPAAHAANAHAKIHFDVPAGPASETLKRAAQQAGLEIAFPVELTKGVSTAPVEGDYEAVDAIAVMLNRTQLTVIWDEQAGLLTIRRTADADKARSVTPESSPRRSDRSAGGPPAVPAPVVGSASVQPDKIVQMGPYDVTVNVQKRPQSAQQVPISMTAISARNLEVYQVSNLSDLSRQTPNLLVSSFSPSSPTIAIRGANNTFSQIGVNKPVAVVIDDVYIPRNSANSFQLFDLDSAEVLRGPQGTLFGRNVTGGAIVFNTRLPSFSQTEIEGEATYGNYQDIEAQAFVSVPIDQIAAAKITLYDHKHDGYGYDRLNGRAEDNEDSSAVRSQLLLKAAPRLTALFSVDYADDRNQGRTLSSVGFGEDGNRRTSELGYPQSFARQVWGISAHLDWNSPAGDFSSITAYRNSRSADDYSGVGVSYLLLPSGSQAVTRDLDHPGTFTQEFRYASIKWSHFDFVSGLYFLDEDGYRNVTSRAFAAGTGTVITNQIADERVLSHSSAAYLDGTIHLVPMLDLTLGGRFTFDRKVADVVHTDLLVPANTFSGIGLGKDWHEFTPRAVLAWLPVPTINAYLSVTKGYTAGGFNGDAAVLSALQHPFDPETVTNYEAGIKTTFFQNRLRANLAVFDEKYNNKQELYFDTVARILNIFNASQATITGAEVELSGTPLPGLNLSGSLGTLDARYDKFLVPGVLNYTHNPLGSAPNHKYSLAGDYEFPIGKLGYLTAMASWSETAGYYTGATKDPNLFVPGYALANASVGYQTADRRWRLTLWCHNLQNTEYLLTPSTQTVLAEYLGDPRTYGVTVGFRY